MIKDFITYFTSSSERLHKRVIVFCFCLFFVWIVDGSLGFSEFYFEKSKIESLSKISTCLRDTSITVESRNELLKDYYRISRMESYRTSISQLPLPSFISRSANRGNLIDTLKHPDNKSTMTQNLQNDKKDTKSIFYFIDIVVYILTGGFMYFLFATIIYMDRKKNKGLHKIENRKLIFGMLIMGFITPAYLTLLPPYLTGWVRYLFNIMYSVISIVILTYFTGSITLSNSNQSEK